MPMKISKSEALLIELYAIMRGKDKYSFLKQLKNLPVSKFNEAMSDIKKWLPRDKIETISDYEKVTRKLRKQKSKMRELENQRRAIELCIKEWF